VSGVNFAELNGRDLVTDQIEICRSISAVGVGERDLNAPELWIESVKTVGRS